MKKYEIVKLAANDKKNIADLLGMLAEAVELLDNRLIIIEELLQKTLIPSNTKLLNDFNKMNKTIIDLGGAVGELQRSVNELKVWKNPVQNNIIDLEIVEEKINLDETL